jgi:hypothetical protein
MKNLIPIAAITAITLGAVGVEAAELPSYELMGFPINPHQFSVLGSSNVKEQSPRPSLSVAGMPASPHQIAVLTPRRRPTEDLAVTNPITPVTFDTR